MKKTIYEDSYRYIIFQFKDKRKTLNLRQEDLGKLLGKYQKYVDRYENFSRKLDIIEILTISQVLCLDFIDLMKTFEMLATKDTTPNS